MKYSIIIPHLNEGYLLDIMLDSIYNQFHYDNFEIIIVDDGSNDISHLDFTKTHFLKDKIAVYFEHGL
jgi:cellulose synthase/poly-beta-1,6-N-acetylglucosamine synthase-like glycosyltransferase